jgi:hypothetical protein
LRQALRLLTTVESLQTAQENLAAQQDLAAQENLAFDRSSPAEGKPAARTEV